MEKIASGARGEVQIPEAPYERQLITRDGQQRWILWHDAKGPGNLIIGVGHDITERKQAEQRIQTQVKRLTALSEIDRAISSSFGLDISLGAVLAHVTEQLHVDAASILIFNALSNTLSYAAGRGFRTKAFEKAKTLRVGEGYAGRAVLDRRIIHVPNLLERNDNPRLQKALPSESFVSYYCLPLIAKGSVKGVLEIFQRSPLEPDADWLDFLQTLAGQAAIAIDNAALFNGIQRSNVELTMAYDATIEGWSKALDLRDKETEGHTQRVTDMTLRLAHLFGLQDEDLVHVRRGALLHDIGKMGVPDGILLKPGPLTDDEWLIMRKHTQFAFDMLAPIHYLGPALDIPYCHHEKWDGSGYPRGLKGEQIPLAARIFALVDVWDAVTSDRPYRPAWSEERAYEYIETQSGTHFDPRVVRVSLESGLLRKKPQPVKLAQTE
jgi:putative nucleotidyltransferase with HDIG domain